MFRKRSDAPTVIPAGRSVYERVLGDRFAELDPRLRAYFGAVPEGLEGFGAGVFEHAGLRTRLLRPLFALLGRWHVAFAEYGAIVPFTVRNTPAFDGSLRAVRTFRFATATREMTDTMRVVEGRLVDRVGVRGRVEVELDVFVVGGQVTMQSRRIALRIAGLRVPLPAVVRLLIRERALSGREAAQHVDVRMMAPLVGEIYGYRGTFTYSLQARTAVPDRMVSP